MRNDILEDDYLLDREDNKERNIDVSESKYENKVFQLQQMITHFEYRLRGYSLRSNGEQYYYTGDALLGEGTVKEVMMLLHPFSREINMISNKSSFAWEKQKLMTRLSLIRLLVPCYDGDVTRFNIIWRTFSNLLQNIGDIIVAKNSQGVIKGLFGIENPLIQTRERIPMKEKEVIV